ncbi:MAG TPA: YciI family protein [Sporichthyaceae bacterium]|jgi:hypothetical protein|nr:YciI family protein [Sporichthyaceae bacterium]
MTQYLMSVWHEWAGQMPAGAEMEEIFADVSKFNEELQAGGQWVFAGGLHPPTTATVVRSVDGKITTTDGPFVETKEMLGGFWVINAPDLDAALALAARATVACRLPVEVRPFQDHPGAE